MTIHDFSVISFSCSTDFFFYSVWYIFINFQVWAFKKSECCKIERRCCDELLITTDYFLQEHLLDMRYQIMAHFLLFIKINSFCYFFLKDFLKASVKLNCITKIVFGTVTCKCIFMISELDRTRLCIILIIVFCLKQKFAQKLLVIF